jgi:hypothetical protein
LKKARTVSGFIKKIQGISYNFGISRIYQNCFCMGKVMNRVYGSRDHDYLSVHGGLTIMGRRDRSEAQKFIVIAHRERERRSLRFSPMVPLGGGAVEMVTQR